MTSFDFGSYVQAYLSISGADNHASSHRKATASLAKLTFGWQVLTGGLTNHTARVSFAAPLRDVLSTSCIEDAHLDADLLDQVSVILKQAPPFIAADPTQAMSVDRQLIEKTALQILNSRDKGANKIESWKGLERLPEGMNVRIPRLIWHDRHKNVLWIEDLGEKMKPLSEVLLDDSAPAAESGSSEEQKRARLERIASDLGSFLARLYSATSNPPERIVSSLTTSSDHNSIHEYLARMVLDNLLRSEAGVSQTDARVLADRVRLGLQENTKLAGEEMCLGMVDFWPGSVLIDIGDSDNDGDGTPGCGLVDWEYFGPSNAASELGMFLAHLHIHLLNSTTSARTKERIQLFADGMFRGYAKSQEALETDLEITWKPSNTFKRRVLLSHGREMVNGVALFEAKMDDEAKRRTLAAGVRSLRAAGSSTDEVDLGELGGISTTSNGSQLIWKGFVALGFEWECIV